MSAETQFHIGDQTCWQLCSFVQFNPHKSCSTCTQHACTRAYTFSFLTLNVPIIQHSETQTTTPATQQHTDPPPIGRPTHSSTSDDSVRRNRNLAATSGDLSSRDANQRRRLTLCEVHRLSETSDDLEGRVSKRTKSCDFQHFVRNVTETSDCSRSRGRRAAETSNDPSKIDQTTDGALGS